MKKILVTLVSVILVVSLCSVFASALTVNLIPSDAQYDKVDAQGHTATITFTDGKAVVSSDGSWPSVKALYAADKIVTADVDKYSIHYDFTVAGGETNISFLFSKSATDPDNGLLYPISNNKLEGAKFTQGSGDLQAGTYTGTMKLSDLVNSSTNLDKVAFDKSFVVDGKLIFSGIQVYSVNGATVTINALELVCEDEPSESSGDESTGSTSSEATSSEAASSEATPSADTSSTTSTTPSTGDAGIIVLVVMALVAVMGASVMVKARR